MNRIIYFASLLIVFLGVTSCLIDDKYLEKEILQEFEKERGENSSSGSSQGFYMPNCFVEIKDMCALSGECAFLVSLSGNSVGYKYFSSNTRLTEDEVYKRAKNLSYVINGEKIPYIEKSDFNCFSVPYSGSYLYVVAYGEKYGYGKYVEKKFSKPNSDFSEIVNIINLRRTGNGDEIKWTFAGTSNPFYYVILQGEKATFAKMLSDSEFALYMEYCGEKYTGSASATPKEMSLYVDEFPVTIGTRSFKGGIWSNRIMRSNVR